MKTIFAIILWTIVLVNSLLAVSTKAQDTKPKMINNFGSISNGDAKARMDDLAQHLTNDPNTKAYIIVYGGNVHSLEINAATSEFYRRCYLPRKGDSQRKINFYRAYMTSKPWKFESSRLVFINGGYKERETTEFWLVSQGQDPPKLTATIKEKDVKFRKGYEIKKSDILKDCQLSTKNL